MGHVPPLPTTHPGIVKWSATTFTNPKPSFPVSVAIPNSYISITRKWEVDVILLQPFVVSLNTKIYSISTMITCSTTIGASLYLTDINSYIYRRREPNITIPNNTVSQEEKSPTYLIKVPVTGTLSLRVVRVHFPSSWGKCHFDPKGLPPWRKPFWRFNDLKKRRE